MTESSPMNGNPRNSVLTVPGRTYSSTTVGRNSSVYERQAGHCGSAHSTSRDLGIRRAEHPAVLRDARQLDDRRRDRRRTRVAAADQRDGDERDRGGNRNGECEDDRSSRRAVARARIHRHARRSVPVVRVCGLAEPLVRGVTPRLTPPSQWPSLERVSSFVVMIELATERKTTPITARQREVVALIAAGCSNDEVGMRLGISPRTAKAHCDVLRQKLGVRRRRQIPIAFRLLTGEDPLSAGRRYMVAARLPR